MLGWVFTLYHHNPKFASDSEELFIEYEFFAGLASTYLFGSGGEWGTGPGVWLEVDGSSLAAFARKLEEEMEAARNDP